MPLLMKASTNTPSDISQTCKIFIQYTYYYNYGIIISFLLIFLTSKYFFKTMLWIYVSLSQYKCYIITYLKDIVCVSLNIWRRGNISGHKSKEKEKKIKGDECWGSYSKGIHTNTLRGDYYASTILCFRLYMYIHTFSATAAGCHNIMVIFF